MKRITSRQNAIVARYRAAARHGAGTDLLLDGSHLVGEALNAGMPVEHAIVSAAAEDRQEIRAIADRLVAAGAEVVSGTAAVMSAVSPVRSPSAIVALAARLRDASSRVFAAPTPLIVIAAGVQDAGNVGAIARVAEAAGATGLVLAGASADPFGWKALRGSMGSALRLPIVSCDDIATAIEAARGAGCRVCATVPRGGTPLFESRLDGPLALLIGAEGAGLPADLTDRADLRVTIPMQPPVESLNAAVAAALVVYEARRQRDRS